MNSFRQPVGMMLLVLKDRIVKLTCRTVCDQYRCPQPGESPHRWGMMALEEHRADLSEIVGPYGLKRDFTYHSVRVVKSIVGHCDCFSKQEYPDYEQHFLRMGFEKNCNL